MREEVEVSEKKWLENKKEKWVRDGEKDMMREI